MSAKGKLTTTVSTKGQVILPKAIREQRHWPKGSAKSIADMEAGIAAEAKRRHARNRY